MKLGIVADEIDRDFRKAVAIGRSVGIERYEVRNLVTGRIPLCDPAEIAAIEEAGVEITAISPGLFKFTEDDAGFRREMAETYPRAAELAHRWHLPGLIVFGFHKPGATEAAPAAPCDPPAQVVDWLAAAGERAAADGLVLMIEPEPICWCDTATRTAGWIEQSGATSLRINYDPGNVAWLQNRDPLDDLDAAAPWIANVHVKDLRPLTRGPGHPEWVPAGEGMIDFAAHFEALERSGYRGPISLEPHIDGRVETIARAKAAALTAAAHPAGERGPSRRTETIRTP
jgi:L-ribulose-5-phosphate 3-epimerase